MNIFNVFSARFFAAAKLCVFSFVLVNLPFSVNAQSADLHSQTNHYSNEILEAKKEEAHKKRRRLEQLTLTLAKQIKQHKNNNNSINSNQLNDLIDTAQSRQNLISELLELSPNAVKRSKLPNKISKHAPEEIKQYLLQQQELEGELEIFYEDYEQVELSRLRHVLKTKTGRVELHFSNTKSLSNLKHGSKVKAKGLFTQSDDFDSSAAALIESKAEVALLVDDGNTVSTASVAPAQLSNTLGEQKTLVLLVNFQDNSTEQPWTKEEVEQMVFGTVNDYYQEASYGQTWLTGDVMGYYTLPIDSICEHDAIYNAAQQVVSEQSIDTSSYERLIYVFPKVDNCGWTGKGTVGGNPSRSWVNGDLTLRTLGHELGHNLGLHHARKLECDVNVLSGDCHTIEYGDSLEIMGNPGFTGHFNAFNKDLMGWFSNDLSSNSAQILTINTEGSFVLEPYESSPEGAAKAIKIQRGTDSLTGQKLFYYLEYRQPLGFDSYIINYPNLSEGVLFHLGTENDHKSSQLIDMTPSSRYTDWDDAVLPVGESYEEAGITITPNWTNSHGASVNVAFTQDSCIHKAPQLTLASEETVWVDAGVTVAYRVKVTNIDNAECQSSIFDVSVNTPIGWETTANNLTLQPGESATVTVEVTSALSVEYGFYDIYIQVENSEEPVIKNNLVFSYVVNTPDSICVRAKPLISIESTNNIDILAGSVASYAVTVINQDNLNCEASDFEIYVNAPLSWTSNNQIVNIEPSTSTTVNIDISSPTTTEVGDYNFELNAENLSEPSYGTSGSILYKIDSSLSCSKANPTLELLTQEHELFAGEAISYSLSLTNNDSFDCDSSNFTFFVNVPSGWSSSHEEVNLTPGDSTNVNIAVTSSAETKSGNFSINFVSENVIDTSYHSALAVEVVVIETINLAPIASDDVAIIETKSPIKINVLANDLDVESDVLTIVSVTQGSKGSIRILTNGVLEYSPAKSFKTSDSFTYSISDGQNLSTATVYVSLESVEGDNSKGKGKRK